MCGAAMEIYRRRVGRSDADKYAFSRIYGSVVGGCVWLALYIIISSRIYRGI